MNRMRRTLKRVPAFFGLLLILTPLWGESFDWNATVAVESSASVGDLADAVEVAPEDLGGDALLDAEDLRSAGEAGYAVQTVFRSSANGQVNAAWTSPGVELELALSGTVLQSPGGYGGDGFAFVPGPGGVRVRRSPSTWSGGRLGVRLGRELLVDPSGHVVRQLVDGAGFAIRYPRLYVSLAAGATGLVDKYVYDARLVPGDASVFSDRSTAIAPARLMALARAEYAGLFANDFGLFAAYYDARTPAAAGDAWYVGLVADGTVAGPLAHRSSIVLQRRGSASSTALLASSDLTVVLAEPRLRLDVGGLYGSGDGASLSRFEAISSSAAGRVIAVPYGDLVRFSLGLTPGPFGADRLTPSIRGAVFFTTDRDAVGDAWLGAEMIGRVGYRLLEDFVISAEGGAAHSPLGWTPYGRMQGRLEL